MSIRLRLASESDATAIAAIYRPIVETTAISFETEAPDEAEIRRRLLDTLRTHAWLVCDIDGHVAGYAYASRHRVRGAYQWSIDTSAYVDERYRRRGVAHGLYRSLLAVAAAQGYCTAFAGIALPNPASVALHERVGFMPLGVYRNVGYKLGAWHDVGWWQLPLRETLTAPPPIHPLTALEARGIWGELLATGLPFIRLSHVP